MAFVVIDMQCRGLFLNLNISFDPFSLHYLNYIIINKVGISQFGNSNGVITNRDIEKLIHAIGSRQSGLATGTQLHVGIGHRLTRGEIGYYAVDGAWFFVFPTTD